MKLNTLATRPADYISLNSPTLPPDRYTAILQLIKQGVTAIELLVTVKTLPNSTSLPKTTKAIVIKQPKLKKAKL